MTDYRDTRRETMAKTLAAPSGATKRHVGNSSDEDPGESPLLRELMLIAADWWISQMLYNGVPIAESNQDSRVKAFREQLAAELASGIQTRHNERAWLITFDQEPHPFMVRIVRECGLHGAHWPARTGMSLSYCADMVKVDAWEVTPCDETRLVSEDIRVYSYNGPRRS